MSGKRKGKQAEEPAVKPWFAWMMRHELLASCGVTVLLGLICGGLATLLEDLLV